MANEDKVVFPAPAFRPPWQLHAVDWAMLAPATYTRVFEAENVKGVRADPKFSTADDPKTHGLRMTIRPHEVVSDEVAVLEVSLPDPAERGNPDDPSKTISTVLECGDAETPTVKTAWHETFMSWVQDNWKKLAPKLKSYGGEQPEHCDPHAGGMVIAAYRIALVEFARAKGFNMIRLNTNLVYALDPKPVLALRDLSMKEVDSYKSHRDYVLEALKAGHEVLPQAIAAYPDLMDDAAVKAARKAWRARSEQFAPEALKLALFIAQTADDTFPAVRESLVGADAQMKARWLILKALPHYMGTMAEVLYGIMVPDARHLQLASRTFRLPGLGAEGWPRPDAHPDWPDTYVEMDLALSERRSEIQERVAIAAHRLVDITEKVVKNLGKDQTSAVEEIHKTVAAIIGSDQVGWMPGLEEFERVWQCH